MAHHNTPDEIKLIKLIEKMPFTSEEKQGWIDTIKTGSFGEELAEEIRQKLTSHQEGQPDQPGHARLLVEYARRVKQWRLSTQSRHFGRHG